MNKIILNTMLISMLALAGCGGDGNTPPASGTGTPGTGTPAPGTPAASIQVITTSGATLDLTGAVWSTVCYTSNGGVGPDINEGLLFTVLTGPKVAYDKFSYPSTDGSCTGTATLTDSYVADVTVAASASAIQSWVNGGSITTVPPLAAIADGSSLTNTESYTQLDYLITAGTGFAAGFVGSTIQEGYVVDDTITNGVTNKKVIYRLSSLTIGSTADPFMSVR